jgi:hypothetical protein
MKVYWGVDMKLHIFLNSVLGGRLHALAALTQYPVAWDQEPNLDIEVKAPCSFVELNPGTSSHPVHSLLYR